MRRQGRSVVGNADQAKSGAGSTARHGSRSDADACDSSQAFSCNHPASVPHFVLNSRVDDAFRQARPGPATRARAPPTKNDCKNVSDSCQEKSFEFTKLYTPLVNAPCNSFLTGSPSPGSPCPSGRIGHSACANQATCFSPLDGRSLKLSQVPPAPGRVVHLAINLRAFCNFSSAGGGTTDTL